LNAGSFIEAALAASFKLARDNKNYQKFNGVQKRRPCFDLETTRPWIRQNIR
jgi:hypothetical protein